MIDAAVLSLSFLRRASGCAVALAALSAAAPAFADSPCARYGADYVAVTGSTSCVKLGGHVRVELGRKIVAPLSYAPTPDGVQRVAHQPAPFMLNDIFPR